jgi:phage tail sheath protein FI
MAETLISPGVLARENDSSFIRQQPVSVGAAIIGPTVLGPIEIPTIVTSYSDYLNKFGGAFQSGSDSYAYLTSQAAFNYFNNNGTSLLVARVVSKSADWSVATSTTIGSIGATGSATIVLNTISKGTIMNSSSSLDLSGSLTSGTENNVRWQILNSDTSSGTFSLLIRQGNDNTNNQTVLETFTNLSLDPFAPNFVSRVIGDQVQNYSPSTNQIETSGSYFNGSRYVYVSAVNNLTPNYFDNTGVAKTQFTGSIPVNASGSFTGATGTIKAGAKFYDQIDATDTQGLVGTSYDNMIDLLANQDDYKFNIILTPGLIKDFHATQCNTIVTNTQTRGDSLYVVDLVGYSTQTLSSVTSVANSINTSYAATYWPWVQVLDSSTGKNVWVPASTVIGGVYAYNDSVSEPWFAPAGINRGGLQVIRAAQKLPQSSRDTLYTNKVNPIATFPGTGTVVYGQKTLQTQASALDRVNVRRLLIALKNYISQIANTLVFEQNTLATRNSFLSQVNPYLTSVQQKQGLYAYRVIMDDTNNTADVIDRNQLIGQIYIQPTRTAEFIYLDFNILPTGATFPA